MLSSVKRNLDSNVEAVHLELEEILNEAKSQEEKAKKAMVDCSRLADELRQEQEFAQAQDKSRKAMETQMKDLQAKLEIAEGEIKKLTK